jgi:acetyl esterase/lipase
LVVLVGVLSLWHPARVAVQTLLILPSMFPSSPVDPLVLLTPQPALTEHSLSYPAGTVQASIVHPASGGRHGAMIFVLGVGDLPRSDLAFKFADALARSGIVVMLPESSGLRAEHLSFAEIDGLRASYELLVSQPDVDPDRTGFVGLSAAGGLCIVAAAQPELRDRVRFVNSFGSYADARRLLLDVASRSIQVDDEVRSWQPDQRTLEVVSNALQDSLGADDPEIPVLSAGLSRDEAAEIIAGLPPAAQQQLSLISPLSYLGQLHAHVYLMHDTDDPFIPFTESRLLTADAPPGVVVRSTEFSIFAHVIPDRPVPLLTFLPDLWRLFWHVHAVLLEML